MVLNLRGILELFGKLLLPHQPARIRTTSLSETMTRKSVRNLDGCKVLRYSELSDARANQKKEGMAGGG